MQRYDLLPDTVLVITDYLVICASLKLVPAPETTSEGRDIL